MRAGDGTVGFTQHSNDVLPFQILQSSVALQALTSSCQLRQRSIEDSSVRENDRPLHKVLKLPNIPWPFPFNKGIHGGARDNFDWFAHSPGKLLDEMAHQQRDVCLSLIQ